MKLIFDHNEISFNSSGIAILLEGLKTKKKQGYENKSKVRTEFHRIVWVKLKDNFKDSGKAGKVCFIVPPLPQLYETAAKYVKFD